jgi:hypothetical protein
LWYEKDDNYNCLIAVADRTFTPDDGRRKPHRRSSTLQKGKP